MFFASVYDPIVGTKSADHLRQFLIRICNLPFIRVCFQKGKKQITWVIDLETHLRLLILSCKSSGIQGTFEDVWGIREKSIDFFDCFANWSHARA